MRDYGRVAPTFWTRGSGKKLRGKPEAQLVALYLFTCPASSMIGIYHLALPTMAHEMGLDTGRAEQALADVCAVGIAQYDPDEELVYLPEGARYQIGERLKPADRRVKGIESALAQFARHPFALDFARRYAAEFCLRAPGDPATHAAPEPPSKPSADDHAPPSKPLRSPFEGTAQPLGSQARQGTDQAQEQEQQAHTHRERAPVRAQDEDQGPSSATVPIVTAETLLDAVERHPMLSTLHGDATWATRAAGALQGAACRAVDADAAVDAFVADNAAQAPADGPALDDFVRGGRGGIGSYLKRAKQHGDAARARESDRGSAPASVSPDVRVVLGVFGEIWAAKKGRAFVQAAGDEKHAAGIVERALEEASKLKTRPRDIVRFWAEKHLACTDKWVVDSDHALRTMGSQLTSYGLPKPKRTGPPPPAAPPEPPLPTPEESAALAAAARGQFAQIGAGPREPTARPS